MSTLTEFLLARIAEDAASAQRDGWRLGDWDDDLPARVLAECEAKRRIVEGVVPERDPYAGHPDYDALWMLRALALPYADHPDYRNEWRPV